MNCEYIKVYIYCLFLGKRNKQASSEEISKTLDLDPEKVKEAFTYFESLGIVARNESGIVITDLKDREIRKLYRPKTASSPEEAILSSERNKKRSKFISDINNAFFQGVMSPTWYTDIDMWFDKYQFEEDVMYALIRYCYDHKGLSKQYIAKVADSWHSKNIKNSFDLDRYSMEVEKLKGISQKIRKKIKKQGYLTEYEESYLEKWVMVYGYDFDIIELALKKTTSVLNPSFEYINRILTDWSEKGLRTK